VAPVTDNEASLIAKTGAMDSETPKMLTMAAEGTRIAVDPSGSERMARRWFSNWDVWQASIV
jgi:hypothetical protein